MKCSCCTDLFYPKFAMLDPQLCYTLPDHQISAGGTDILAHVMERYFVPDDNHEFSDRMCEAAMISLIHNLPKVLADKKNYDAWAEVMWIGNVAHNGLLARGKRDDWGSHDIEHQLSAHYDIAHGAGLAIIFPAWMKYVWKEKPSMMEQYAVRVWGVSTEGKCLMRKQIKWFPESRFTGIQEIILRLLMLCRSCSQERRQLSQRAANARMYAHDMIGDINGGAVFLINWSILFNSQGGPNHVQNWCEAPVMYDEKTDKIEKKLSFHYIRHFSGFFTPGSVRIGISRYTKDIEACAVQRPDGTIAVVLLNTTAEDKNVYLRMEKKTAYVKLQGNTIATAVIE